MNANAEWSARASQRSVTMPDNSIILMGGNDGGVLKNDVWRSTDDGATWTQVPTNAPWSARMRFGGVVLPDGSIVLMGGSDGSSNKNDVWRLVTAGSSEKNPSHIYNSPGIYQVSLQAYNSNGINVATKTDYITVKEAPPVAGFSGTPISGNVPLTVAFTDKSTGVITSFKWNFGDSATSTDKNPLHKYTVSGRYTVTLTVSNSAGSNTMIRQNYITADKAIAPTGFSGKPTSGTVPLTVSFTDLSSNNPTGWAWYFGDEPYTGPWAMMNSSAEWSARSAHRSVAMPDGSIILMGGQDNTGLKNDVWRSTDNGALWTLVTANTPWSARMGFASVAMPDGSIVLFGGQDSIGYKNDVWQSSNKGETWTQVPTTAPWSERFAGNSVVMPDGSILLIGGQDITGMKNDVWQSTDGGASWVQITDAAEWTARSGSKCVVMMDGSIILMGGWDGSSYKNDVWQSEDNGATWTEVTANAEWSARNSYGSVKMPDGSIILMGGQDSNGPKNDVWRSTDNGATWTQVTANAGWPARARIGGGSVEMPDGSIILMGGQDSNGPKNDVWRLVTAGSSEKNPSHIYNSPGIYQVSLRAYNSNGFSLATQSDYITVKEAPPIAGFSGTPTSGTVPLIVAFSDASSGVIASYKWDFGDGFISTNKDPLHKYTVSGRYTVTLTVSNSVGSNTMTRQNFITADKPIAPTGFFGTPTSGTAPLTVSFTDLSSNNPTGWAWYFGDEPYTAPWVKMTANAPWSERGGFNSVAMPDSSIILMGGQDINGMKNDVWRSTNNGASWTQMTAGAEWSERMYSRIVKMPDGSIILMGGQDINGMKNDVWRSTNNGASWTLVTANAGWSARSSHRAVTTPDGSIILMGGWDGISNKNDVWRSTNNGASWTLVTANAEWSARRGFGGVVMPDGSIVVMGGQDINGPKNDVWRSTNNGASWTLVTANAEWSARASLPIVTLPDGSIILVGGNDINGLKNDVWRSMNNGASWTLVTANAEWSARTRFNSVELPDGSIMLMGGQDINGMKNDVWRLVNAGSSEKNPVHVYRLPGIYQVSLRAYNSSGFSQSTQVDYITVKEAHLVAGFSGTPISGTVPLTVAFSDASTGDITSYKWDFGDGFISTNKDPLHKYTVSGRYTVKLTVSNSAGSNTMTRKNYIIVK